jgi:carbonic anhydrase
MKTLDVLIENNRQWSEKIRAESPDFFPALTAQQNPEYLWIGCSDSRVPANQIIGLLPGEVFVHRNVANVVVHTDLNCLSAVQFAVDVLKVKHILVVGHYGCGGVRAALTGSSFGLVDNWLRHVQDVRKTHGRLFELADPEAHWDALCRLNVVEQVVNVAETTILRDAWARGDDVTVHGWIYSLNDGIVNDLHISIDNVEMVREVRERAVEEIYTIALGKNQADNQHVHTECCDHDHGN